MSVTMFAVCTKSWNIQIVLFALTYTSTIACVSVSAKVKDCLKASEGLSNVDVSYFHQAHFLFIFNWIGCFDILVATLQLHVDA